MNEKNIIRKWLLQKLEKEIVYGNQITLSNSGQPSEAFKVCPVSGGCAGLDKEKLTKLSGCECPSLFLVGLVWVVLFNQEQDEHQSEVLATWRFSWTYGSSNRVGGSYG